MVIDEGTHEESYMGEAKDPVQKCRIGFELPLRKHIFNEEKGEEPFTLSVQFTYSMHEKAKMRKFLVSWRGKEYTPESLTKFLKGGIPLLLGQPALINVIHVDKKSSEGKFAKIVTAMPLPEGMICPPAILPPIKYSQEQGRDAVFQSLSKWLQEEIAQCIEWRPKIAGNEPSDVTDGSPQGVAGPNGVETPSDDPF